jgi:hypothetical protein
MEFFTAWWQLSPLTLIASYISIGCLILIGTVKLDYYALSDFFDDVKLVLPGGRLRYRVVLQTELTGWTRHRDGTCTDHYRDENEVQSCMKHYRHRLFAQWLYILAPLFLWPLLITAIVVVILGSNLLYDIQLLWQRVTGQAEKN